MILALVAVLAQIFTPPVPKSIGGDGHLNRVDIPLPPPKERWLRVRSPHFTIISSASDGETRDLAQNLETLAVALQRLHPRFRELPLAQSRVLLFDRRGDAQPYFDLLISRGTNSRGAFIYDNEGKTMVLSTARRPDRTPYHELVHELLGGRTHPPLWLEEGLAEYYSYSEIRLGKLRVIPALRHVLTLRKRGIVPMQEILSVPRDAFPPDRFYMQSWAAVDWLMRTNRAAFDAFEADVENGMPAEDALRKHYHATIRNWEQGMAGAGRVSPFITDAPSVAIAITSEPLPRPDVLCELGSFLGEFESTRADAERHFRAALEIDPHHARALAGLGLLRAKAKELEAAIPFFEQAASAAPYDPLVLLTYAEALLGNAIGPFAGAVEERSEARFRHARELAQCALELGADETRARGDLGVSLTIEHDVAPAIEQLEIAHRLAPGRDDLALNLFAMYLRSGQREKANALNLEQSRSAQIVFAAKAILVRELTARANALVSEQKLDDAVAIVRELAAATEDAAARRDLKLQAAQLARTAETNRHIIEYNTALEETKRGDRKAALKRIDALLAVATDMEVIHDAEELRKELLRH